LLVEDRADRWVVVSGGPGMGKSALLAAWLDRRDAAHVGLAGADLAGDLVEVRSIRIAIRLDLGTKHNASLIQGSTGRSHLDTARM
jgi:hypothetical protein